jgi:hypothetical protein
MKIKTLALGGALALALGLAGCGAFRPYDTATMPLTPEGAPVLSQNDAIALSSWALKDPANTAGNPARAARAIAAEDWLAGQSILYGNFGTYAPGGELSWQQFRQQARAAIGVPPNAPSQELVNRLLAVDVALKAGQPEAAKAQLAAPIFTLGPDRTLAALANLPKLPGRDWAFAELNRNEDRTFGPPPMSMFH